MVSCSCFTSGTRRVNLVTNPVISLEWFLVGFVLLESSNHREELRHTNSPILSTPYRTDRELF
jgi:hypothetical protein